MEKGNQVPCHRPWRPGTGDGVNPINTEWTARWPPWWQKGE